MEQEASEYHSRLIHLMESDPWRKELLTMVSEVTQNAGWIGGGFVRHAVWDMLAGYPRTVLNDIDVIYLGDGSGENEKPWSKELEKYFGGIKWSVKDQNRMAAIHSHHPYKSIREALIHWVEKCTAVAVRGKLKPEICAPYGLEDLFQGIISPTSVEMIPVMEERIRSKGWIERYPFLEVSFH